MLSLRSFSKSFFMGTIQADLQFSSPQSVDLQFQWPKIWNLCEIEKEKILTEVQSRKDELWKSTCFELFLKQVDSPLYWELNVSPKGDWNAYLFQRSRYPSPPQPDPRWTLVFFHCEPGHLRVQFHFQDELPKNFQVGITSVLALENQTTEYWALDHCSSRPDFHNEKSFILQRTAI